MTELAWFDGEADSLDQLLEQAGSYRIDSLVVAIEEALLAKENLSPAERVVVAVEALEREVNNGGYNQFFLNEAEQVPYIIDSLTAAGCPNVAAITAEAIAVLDPQPGSSAEDISNAAAQMEESDDERLSVLDQRFYEYPDPIADRLFAYIAAHRDEITLRSPAEGSGDSRDLFGQGDEPYSSLVPIVDLLVAGGNVALDGGFVATPDGGWRCRMRDPLDIEHLLLIRKFGSDITLSKATDTIAIEKTKVSIEGPGAQSGTTA